MMADLTGSNASLAGAGVSGLLTEQQQGDIVERVASIFQEEGEEGHEVSMQGIDEEGAEEKIDQEDVKRRTQSLRWVFELLGKLWWGKCVCFEAVTERLADGSRDPRWRSPIGEAGILSFYLEILNTQTLDQPLKIQILRLIGNTCADTDTNRALLVASNSLTSVITQLQDDALLSFAIPVLYNICVDYEPAQKQASESYLTKDLIDIMSSARIDNAVSFIDYLCKLLDLMVAQESDKELAPEYTAHVLIKLAVSQASATDLEDFLSLVASATRYLAHERFQQALITFGGLEATLEILVQSYSRFDSQIQGHPSLLDSEDAAALTQVRSSLNEVLADISALPNFREAAFSATSSVFTTLRRWLISPHMQLQISACIILGNISRSDSVCIEMVQQHQIHKPLISIITTANDSQLLHSALGFLKNLALPLSNKPILGSAGLVEALPRLWNLDSLQQIQFSAISLARQIITQTFPNVRLLGRPLSWDQASPASSKTKISFLIDLFDRTDVEPIKMEISRLITAMCRVWNSVSDPTTYGLTAERLVEMRIAFFERHPDIGRPLAFMVSQTKWPVVRSEGWFVFALMARFPEGADRVSEVMHDVKVFEALVELMTGKSILEYTSSRTGAQASTRRIENADAAASQENGGGGESLQPQAISPGSVDALLPPSQTPGAANSQSVDMQRIDRMNALVLLSELLKNKGDRMAVMRRAMFEDLLQGGGEIVSGYSEKERMGVVDKKAGCGVPNELSNKGSNLGDLARQSFADVL